MVTGIGTSASESINGTNGQSIVLVVSWAAICMDMSGYLPLGPQ